MPRSDGGAYLLARDEVIVSPETLLGYRVERMLGEGGFGAVYLARKLGRSPLAPDALCRASERPAGGGGRTRV